MVAEVEQQEEEAQGIDVLYYITHQELHRELTQSIAVTVAQFYNKHNFEFLIRRMRQHIEALEAAVNMVEEAEDGS